MATTKKSTAKEEPKGGTGLTTAALVLGIIGAVFAFIPIANVFTAYPLGALAIIFGGIGVYKKHGGKAIAGLILGIAAVVITCLMNILVFSAANTVVNELNKASGEATEAILADDIDVTIGEFTVKDDGSFANTALPITVKNKTDKTISLSIKIEAVNSEGVVIDSDTALVSGLSAGSTAEETTFKYVVDDDVAKMKAATFRVSEVSEW